MNLIYLLTRIKQMPNCKVLYPNGVPNIESYHNIPNDLLEFYTLCGGISLFENEDYSIKIISPDEFLLTNPIILGEYYEDDITSDWYIIAKNNNGQYISIDLNPNRLGKCYDSYIETHGLAGDCPIIALSFTELLEKLVNNHGDYWYWLKDDFISLGDAYD